MNDINIVLKAYLRRGAAYEHLEKYKPAVDDFTRVRELDPYNNQARQALTRCMKYIEQDEGITYKPKLDDLELPPMQKEEAPKVQAPKPKVETPKETPKEAAPKET